MKTILLICLVFVVSSLYSQDTTKSVENEITFKWNKWRLNGKRIYRDEVKAEMMKVDEAFLYYKKSRNNLTIGLIAYVPMVTFALLGQQSTNVGSPSFGKPKYGFNIAGLLFAGVSFYEMARSSKNSKKAASIYNEY